MEIIKVLFLLPIGILILLFVGYLMSYITGGISKIFGTTTTLNGRIVATPNTLDDNINELKILKNKLVTVCNTVRLKINSKPILNISDKIKFLVQIEELKKSNAIDQKEYDELREQVLSKTK